MTPERNSKESAFLKTHDYSSPRRHTIFVVDRADDRSRIRRVLRNVGFRVSGFLSGELAIRTALNKPPSMFILETALPRGDGLSLCNRIRQTPGLSLLPVLFVSHRRQEADKVAGLSAGADDYITKPFGERELVARVMASLRRYYELSRAPQFRFGDVKIDSDTITLTVKDVPVEISLSEFRLLDYFVRNPSRTFSRDHLLRVVRSGPRQVNPRIVDVYVQRIRNKIEVDENNPRYLRTVRGLGYCFHLPERRKASGSGDW